VTLRQGKGLQNELFHSFSYSEEQTTMFSRQGLIPESQINGFLTNHVYICKTALLRLSINKIEMTAFLPILNDKPNNMLRM